MWLYVPNLSTSLVSAPGGVDSISESSWQFQALEASAWWRGRPSPSRSWWQRCRRDTSLRLLYGVMPEPSLAALGVARWMASLAASRANHIARLASASAAKTRAISGRRQGGLSSRPDRGLFSLRTFGACSQAAGSKEYGETFADLVSRLNLDCLRRQRSALHRYGQDSSSSQWPTPNATDGEKGSTGQTFARGNLSLTAAAAAKWPTPMARDHRSGGDGRARHNGPMLPDVAERWATPRALEKGQYTRDHGNPEKARPSLTGQAFSLQARATSPDGKPPLPLRRSLNPLFVEWLMGWPPGWTLLAWTDFACSATALSRWKRHMRSALSHLGLPRGVAPAQFDLFG